MSRTEKTGNDNLNRIAMILVVLVLLASVGGWFWLTKESQNPEILPPIPELPIPDSNLPEQPLPVAPLPEPEIEPEPIIEPEPEAPVANEIAPEPEPEPLPSLTESDDFAKTQIQAVSDGMELGDRLVGDNLIRRLTVFIDNLASGEILRDQGPFSALLDSFPVLELNNRIYLDPEGYHRYDLYADFLERLDEAKLAEHYLKAEPLLQQAFAELGYSEEEFQPTLIQAMDELLSAPEYDQPLELKSFSVNYQFADNAIETRSDAQKLMIRMGPENARKVKAFLRRFKTELDS